MKGRDGTRRAEVGEEQRRAERRAEGAEAQSRRVAKAQSLKVGTESTASRPTRRGRRVAAFIVGAADRESNGRKHY